MSDRELAARVDALADRVDELESELADERERRERAEERIEELESTQRGRDWVPTTVFQLEDALADGGGWEAEQTADERGAVLDRLDRLERDAIEPEDVMAVGATDPSELLPIQQLYGAVKADRDEPRGNKRRAAKVWPHYNKYADPSGGRLTLTSGDVRNIFAHELDDERDDPNANTVRRTMRWLAEYSDGLISFDTEGKVNQLVCDRDEWVEVTNDMMRAATDGREDAPATNAGAESRPVRTDGGER